jgi:hypothetical protein
MPAPPFALTLGALHRVLCDDLSDWSRRRVAIHFEQRSATAVESAHGRDPDLLAVRRFEAVFDFDDTSLARVDLSTGGRASAPRAAVAVVSNADGYLYSIDGVRFGRLERDPELFDAGRFENQLDAIAVDDLTLEQVPAGARSILVLDLDVSVPSFRELLAVFAGEPESEDLDLRAYSVVLSAAAETVTLEYWWSLVAVEEFGAGGDTYQHDIACHVEIAMSPSSDPVPAVIPDPELPALAHIDEVWDLARRLADQPPGAG